MELQLPVLRRVFAWCIDYGLVMVVAAALVTAALISLVHSVPGYVGGVAATAGWEYLLPLFTHHGHEAGGLLLAASDEWLHFVLPLLGALAAVPLLQFVYQA